MTIEADIRRAEPGDVPAIAAVINGWIDKTPWFERTLPAIRIEALIAEALPARDIWVIGDPIDGYLSVDPSRSFIGALYCRTTGAGHGKALLDQAKMANDRLVLHTHVPNVAARRFYRREGFREVARVEPEPPETVPEIRMEWHR